jgi:tetratricopeptide (TPR) repeat protein
MGVKAELSDFLRDLPAVDYRDERRALLTYTGPSELAFYLDWEGSKAEFTERLLGELSRRGKVAVSSFLAGLPNTLQVQNSEERQQELEAIRTKVEALDEAAFRAEFPVPLPAAAPAERPSADPAMLAAAVVNEVLAPYYKLGGDQLRQKAGGRAVALAKGMAEEVKEALSGDVNAGIVLDIFQQNPEAGQAGMLKVLKARLEGDSALAGELADVYKSAAAEPEGGGLQSLVEVSQEIGLVRGDVVGAVVGDNVLKGIGAKIDVDQHIGTVEPGGVVTGAVIGGSGQIGIDQFMARVERGDIIGVQQIFNYMEQDEAAQDRLVGKIVERLKLEGLSITQLGSQPVPEDMSHQIQNIILAQKEVAARGLQASAETLLRLGKLAAYDRDYEEAVSYFRQASQADPGYEAAWEAIVWLQQARAMHDIQARDYDAAVGKLAEARSAANHTDPLDPRALAMRGYIAKTLAQISETRMNQLTRKEHLTLAQISEAGKNQQARLEHLEEAKRFFGHVVQLNPEEAGAWNGLGNVQAMLGDEDAAIGSYERAIELEPNYTAAYHDLGISCEAKMTANPDDKEQWCRRALDAWQSAYALAPMDPGFSEHDVVAIGRRVQWLRGKCGEGG